MDTSRRLASYLLQSKAIIIDPANPFTWASGWKSPIYCDNRKTLSYPEIRRFIRDSFLERIEKEFTGTDMIAGVATGAIAMAALVAEEMDLPMLYVRSGQKAHGLGNQVEGDVSAGRDVVVIEDLVSTGGSSLNAIHALREAGLHVLGMCAIFSYGFPIAESNFQNAGVRLCTLGNYDDLMAEAAETGFVDPADLDTLKKWRENPSMWKS